MTSQCSMDILLFLMIVHHESLDGKIANKYSTDGDKEAYYKYDRVGKMSMSTKYYDQTWNNCYLFEVVISVILE